MKPLPFDLAAMDAVDPVPPGWANVITLGIFDALLALRRTRIVVEGLEHLPTSPCWLAQNHTHKFDFLPLYWALWRLGGRANASTWTKSRAWSDPTMAWFLKGTGNVPLASKGWLIAADWASVHGERPPEAAYRALREHLEGRGSWPEGPGFAALLRPRSLHGAAFDPARCAWREAILGAWRRAAAISLRLGRRSVAAGVHQHLYPQGAISSRLTAGRVGGVQVASALGLPTLPVAVSGVRGAFLPESPLPRGGGVVHVRFGALMPPQPPPTPDFMPLDVEHEARHRALLVERTAAVMERLDALCGPECCATPTGVYDGKEGVARFY